MDKKKTAQTNRKKEQAKKNQQKRKQVMEKKKVNQPKKQEVKSVSKVESVKKSEQVYTKNPEKKQGVSVPAKQEKSENEIVIKTVETSNKEKNDENNGYLEKIKMLFKKENIRYIYLFGAFCLLLAFLFLPKMISSNKYKEENKNGILISSVYNYSKLKVLVDQMNVYERPVLSSNVIKTMKKGDILFYEDEMIDRGNQKHTWYKVDVNGKAGWILLDRSSNTLASVKTDLYMENYVTALRYGDDEALYTDLYDKTGSLLFSYKGDLAIVGKNVFIACTQEKCKLVDEKNKMISLKEYDAIRTYQGFPSGLFQVALDGKEGIINQEGKEVIEPVFDEAIPSGPYIIVKKDAKIGVYNQNGEEIIPIKYSVLTKETDMLFYVEDGEQVGMLNANNDFVLPMDRYTSMNLSLDSLFGCIENVCTLYDLNGKKLSDETYQGMKFISEQLIMVEKDKKYGVITRTGKTLLDPVYDEIEIPNFQNLLLIVKQGQKYGIYSDEGKELQPIAYDDVEKLSYALKVKKNGKYGIVSVLGNQLYDTTYDSITVKSVNAEEVLNQLNPGLFDQLVLTTGKKVETITMKSVTESKGKEKEGLISICLKGKCGFMDVDGNIVIEPKYDMVENFVDGIALVANYVKMDKEIPLKYGFIDKTGKEVVPVSFVGTLAMNGYSRMENGVVVLKKDDGTFVIYHKDGTSYEIAKEYEIPDYTTVTFANEYIPYLDKENKKIGYMNTLGRVAIKAKYDSVQSFNGEFYWGAWKRNLVGANENIAIVCLKDKCALMNPYGKELSEFIYMNGIYLGNGL